MYILPLRSGSIHARDTLPLAGFPSGPRDLVHIRRLGLMGAINTSERSPSPEPFRTFSQQKTALMSELDDVLSETDELFAETKKQHPDINRLKQLAARVQRHLQDLTIHVDHEEETRNRPLTLAPIVETSGAADAAAAVAPLLNCE